VDGPRTPPGPRTLAAAAFFLVAGSLTIVPVPRSRVLEAVFDLAHAPAFLLVAVFLWTALHRWPPWIRGVLVLASAGALGVAIEVAQGLVGRQASRQDVVADVLGAVAGVAWAARGALPARRLAAAAIALAAVAAASRRPVATLADVRRQRGEMPSLGSFESEAELLRWRAREATMARSPEHATDGASSLRLDLRPGEYPGVALAHPVPDWSGHAELIFDVHLDPGPPIALTVKVEDAAFRREHADRFQTILNVQPGAQQLRIPLSHIARGPRGRDLDLTRVARLAFFCHRLDAPRTLFLDRVTLSRGGPDQR
jgi:VanZ family protein